MSCAATSIGLVTSSRLVAIIRSTDPRPLAAAMVDAGVRVLEVSMSNAGALGAMAETIVHSNGGTLIGAGTVVTLEDARRAVDHGAQFLVSPNLDTTVVAWATERDVLHLPGVFTPTEVSMALAAGARLLKLFPAGAVGPDYVSSLLAPFPTAQFVPTGGVTIDNAGGFFSAGAVAVGVGSALTPAELVERPAQLRAHIERCLERISPQKPKE